MKKISKEIRKMVVQMAHDAPSSHVGSALSCVDILVSLYFGVMTDQDRFTLSKGHGAMAYYATLAKKGILPLDMLKTYSRNGSALPEHPPSHGVPGIEVGTGSLGHGLSLAVGAALARKIKKQPGYEFVLLGDGECNEGSVWEAAMNACNLNLGNIIAVVDNNHMQALSRVDCMALGSKFRSFGWVSHTVDGSDPDVITKKIKELLHPEPHLTRGMPQVIIAHTVKGLGVSFMERDLLWHYRPPDDEELRLALEELDNA